MTAKREYLEAALRRCESEAIHLIGLVQPHGVVLALGPEPDYLILQASENVQHVFQQPLDHLLGAPLTQLLGQDHVRTLMTSACAESDCSLTGRLVYARVDGEVRQFHAMPHRVGPLTLLEIEPIFRPFEPKHLVELQEQVRQTVSVLEKLPGLDDCLPFLASQIRLLTGYDRVTVYRFDRDWEGEVIAESLDAERLPSYLGHRFPAGDIPPQARALYEKNPFRLFVDTEVEPSRVVPTLNPLTAAPLDLSQAMLRSFSPVHIEYLRNMDVRAVMSVALLVDGKLWGLIACHHKTPKGLDPPTREMVKFLGVMASMKISALVAAERERISQRINDTIRLLLGLLGPGQPGTLQLVEFDRQLKRLIDATGILIRVDGRFYRRGVLPDDDALQALIAWLDQAHGAGLTVIEQLSARYPQAAAYADIVAGVLAVCLDPVNGDGIYWFRPERSREVKWAGNPEKVLAKDRDGGLMISPRLSFATWTETWRGRSQSWLDEEIELGQRVAAMLHRAFHLILDASMRRPGAPLVEAAGAIDIDPQPLLRNLPAGVVVHAADTRILYANPRALALLRLTEEQALGRQALCPEWQLIDESSRPLPVADYPVNRVLASGGSMSGQVIGIVDSAFGRPTWVLVHAYPQIEAGGDLQVIVTFVEIGDQQRIPFRQIVDLAADVVVVTEADVTPPGPRIVYVNEAMITLSGYRGDEIIGQTPRLFQGPQTDPLTLARIRDHLLRREIVHETVLNYAKSGRPYWLDLAITPLYDHLGQLRYFASIGRDASARMLEHQKLSNAAASDPLTGLLNRRGFDTRANAWLSDPRQRPTHCALVTFDIDHFKQVNDRFGHAAGDDVLKSLGRLVAESLRQDDLCARFGGEEFVVLLVGSGRDEAIRSAERLRQTAQATLTTPDGRSVTISLGVADWRSEDDRLEAVLARADQALYQAKQEGRNRVVAAW